MQRKNGQWNWSHSHSSSTLNWDWLFTTLATTTGPSNSSKDAGVGPELPPPHNFLPAAYEQKGMYSEAIAEFKKAIPLTAGSESSLSKAGSGHVYAVTG